MHRQQQQPAVRGRGGRGRRFGPPRREERQQIQQQNNEEDEQQQQHQGDGERPSHSRHHRQERPIFKKTQKSEPDLEPKKVSTNFTTEKNDPLLAEFSITDGVNGFLEVFSPREFQVDYSGLLVLLDSSYAAQTTTDRSMAKYISRSMWNYYHIILLWRKLLVVRSRIGDGIDIRDQLFALIGEDFPCSTEIAAYLNGLGDVVDQDGARAKLKVQGRLTQTHYYGAAGSYGRVSDQTHFIYETLPSPLVAMLRMRADIMYTDAHPAPENGDWNLPEALAPRAATAGNPTVQLLGWKQSERLTDMQRSVLRSAGFSANDFGVMNVGNIPVNELLMQSISGYIRSSKAQCFKQPLNTHIGSIAQVPFSEKILDDVDVQPEIGVNPNLLLCGKLMRTSTCKQFSIHIASISSTFRYRVKRSIRSPEGAQNRDMLAYRYAGGPPARWIDNANNVYYYGLGEVWNRRVFSTPEVSGIAMASRYCDELRKNTTRK